MAGIRGPNGYVHVPPEERFWDKVDFDGPVIREELGPCWLWTGSTHANGYGYTTDYWKKILVHRLSWEMAYGPIPERRNVCHHCDVCSCVNPKHLWVGTQSENLLDMVAKGRQVLGPKNRLKGTASRQAVLTDDQVREIRVRYEPGPPGRPSRSDPPRVTIRQLAEEYGVASSLIHRIIRREAWPHLD